MSSYDDHGQGRHAHAPFDLGLAFGIGVTLNVGFVIVAAGFGVAARSTALLADAAHNLGDVLGLVLAWVGYSLTKRRPSRRYTWHPPRERARGARQCDALVDRRRSRVLGGGGTG